MIQIIHGVSKKAFMFDHLVLVLNGDVRMGEKPIEKPIQAQVIRIPDEFSIILNKGLAQGVKDGMRFIVYVEGDNILDPTTQKYLGKLLIIKADVTVTNAQENFSIAKSFERTSPSVASEAIRAMFGEAPYPRKLPVNQTDVQPVLEKKDYMIRIGDKAKQVIG